MRKVVVLYYHRIYNKASDTFSLCVTPENFREQMAYLKEHYHILRFEEDWEKAEGDNFVITFDDGYLDNYEYALPILEQLGVPATIFVTTHPLDTGREFWWDELETVMMDGDTHLESFRLEDDRYACQWDTSTEQMRMNCYMALHFLMKYNTDFKKREEWLSQLWQWRGKERYKTGENEILTDESCRRLSESDCITIGCHTLSHPCLAALDASEQAREITGAKDYLEKLLGRQVNVMSYPFGVPHYDYNEDSRRICQEAGISKCASTQSGIWQPEKSAYDIPRNIVLNWDLPTFEKKLEEYLGA